MELRGRCAGLRVTRAKRCHRAARGLAAALLMLGAVSVRPTAAGVLEEVLHEQEGLLADARSSQQRIDRLEDERQTLLSEFREVSQQLESLRVYNDQLEKLIRSQQEEMDSLRSQIGRATSIQREITPLMLRMIDALDELIRLDLPFLLDERRARVERLRALMDRADVSLSEKYRRVLEAYQIEADYGRTLEAYRAPLERDGTRRTVDFLRVGRIALLYLTLDGHEAGRWDPATHRWQTLPASYRTAVRQGLRIARKQAAPDLLTLPVQAPMEAKTPSGRPRGAGESKP